MRTQALVLQPLFCTGPISTAIAAAALMAGCATDQAPAVGGFAEETGALSFNACILANPASIAVPAQCPSIQSAIDHAAAGAVISVAAGTYVENLTIGKILTINGAGPTLTKVKAAVAAAPVLTLSAGSGGAINKLTLTGGSDGVRAGVVSWTGVVPASNVSFTSVTINGNQRGIYGWFAALTLNTVNVTSNSLAGVQLFRTTKLTVASGSYSSNGGPGLSASLGWYTGSVPVSISKANFGLNAGTGLAVAGKNGTVALSSVIASSNGGHGIELTDVSGNTYFTSVQAGYNTKDGIRQVNGTGTTTASGGGVFNNGAAGLWIQGGTRSVTVKDGFSSQSNAGDSIYVGNIGATKTVTMTGLSVVGGGKGGITVEGPTGAVSLTASEVAGAAKANVFLMNCGSATLKNLLLKNAKPGLDGKFGDGLMVWNSAATLAYTRLLGNARAGLSSYGCNQSGVALHGVSVENVHFECNGFDMDFEPSCEGGTAGYLVDGQGNWCSDICNAQPQDTSALPVDVPCPPCEEEPCAATTEYQCGEMTYDWTHCKAQSASLVPLDLPTTYR